MTNTNTNPVAWFEVGTDDPESSRSFYGELFGWTFDLQGPYSIVTTGKDEPLQGGIQDTSIPLPNGTPRSYAIFCVQVADVSATCARVEELGGKVLVPATKPSAGPEYALVADPAGNHLGMFSPM